MWTLLELEITPKRRKEIVHSLEVEDYSQGPLEDRMHQVLPLWVFGKKINAREIYIKVSLGLENSSAVCMSFHVAEHPMTYPYKRIKP
ncbi:MAG: toxin [Bacteroidales bacterium]